MSNKKQILFNISDSNHCSPIVLSSYNKLKALRWVGIVYKKGPDTITLLKLKDMFDVIYIINRIKSSNYDKGIVNDINKVTPINQAENIIRYLSDSSNNKKMNQNAEIFIDLLRNIELLNQNNGGYDLSKSNRNITNRDLFSKIKYFLNSLNNEE